MNLIRKARTLTWAVGMAALLTLSACAGTPGAALKVGETTYSNADIADGVAQVAEMAGRPLDTSAFVSVMATAPLITELAKRSDIVVTDSDISDFIAQQVDEGAFVAMPSGELSVVARDFMRLQIATDKLNTAITDPDQVESLNTIYADLVQNTPVEVNPRYGTFDVERHLVPLTFGDVVSMRNYDAP